MRKISEKVKIYKREWAKKKREKKGKRTKRRIKMDLVGVQFGDLTVIEKAETKRQATFWVCRCKCGNLKTVIRCALTQGTVKSCGCLKTAILLNRNTVHGMTGTKEYVVWNNIKARCYNKKTRNYNDYGGRGITVCDRWRDSFENFFEDMGNCPLGYSLDRIKNNLNYDKGNCRWTDLVTQANNRRNNHAVTFNGETLNLSQWARKLNVKQSRFYKNRFKKWGKEKVVEFFYNQNISLAV